MNATMLELTVNDISVHEYTYIVSNVNKSPIPTLAVANGAMWICGGGNLGWTRLF